MLILLDIDGVLVPAKSWQAPQIMQDGFPAFSNNAVLVLNQLFTGNETIILTSSHKAHYSIREWKEIFKQRGLTVSHLSSLPENKDNLSRKDEILNWYRSKKVNDIFLIIDDDKSLHDLPPPLKEKWLETSSQVGLTPLHLGKMESILSLQSHADHS